MIWNPKRPESLSLPERKNKGQKLPLSRAFAHRALVAVIARLLKKAQKVLIVIHEQPDGDAIASALALAKGLRESARKDVSVVCADKPAPVFAFLSEVNSIQTKIPRREFDVLLILDCGDLNRTGFPQFVREFSQSKKTAINIDHHPKNNLYSLVDYNFCDKNCASTAQLVFQLLRALKIRINRNIATCILTALYTDTGGFMHPNVSSDVMSLASEMMKKGARTKVINKGLRLSRSVSDLQLWGVVFSRLRFNKKYKIAYSYVLKKDFDFYSSQIENLAGAVNLMGVIPQAKISLLLYESEPGMIKGSIRTQEDAIDVSRLASYFGGGGHPKASGFKIPGKIISGKNPRVVLS